MLNRAGPADPHHRATVAAVIAACFAEREQQCRRRQSLRARRSMAARTPTLGNSRISEMILGNGPVFTGLQKSETLNQINDLSQ